MFVEGIDYELLPSLVSYAERLTCSANNLANLDEGVEFITSDELSLQCLALEHLVGLGVFFECRLSGNRSLSA